MAATLSLPAKITQPRANRVLSRKSLLHTIAQAHSESPLIWVSAPGGSGKSTLVSSYLNEYDRRHLWYQIDEGDSDLANLFHYLGLGARKLSPHSKKSFPALTAEYLPGINDFTRRFFNNISSILKANGVLIFDNANLLADDHPFYSLLSLMADALRPGQSIIVISRRDPAASLISLQARRVLSTISSHLLRFNSSEWLELATLLGNHSMNQETLLNLHLQSEGWVSALILATMDRSPRNYATPASSSFTYFAQEIFNNLSPEHQHILLCHTYLHHITRSSSCLVCSCPDAIALITEMSQHNHFVTADDNHQFTFHPLFQEFLEYKSSQHFSTDQLNSLQHLSGRALEEEGSYFEAIVHYQKSGHFTQAIDLLCLHATAILAMGQYERLRTIIASFPESVIAPYATIWFIRGTLSSMSNPKESIDHYLCASEIYKADKQIARCYDALICAIKQITTTLHCFEELEGLLQAFSKLHEMYPVPDEVSQKDLIATLMSAYFISDYDRQQMAFWISRCEREIELNPDPGTTTELAIALLMIYFNECNADKIYKTIDYVRGNLNKEQLPPFTFLASHFNIIFSWLNALDIEEGYQLVMSLKSYARECEVTALDSVFLIAESKFELFRGNHQPVEDNLQALYPLCRGDNNYLSNYYYLHAQYLIRRGVFSVALDSILYATQVLGDANPFAWRIVLDDARAELLYWNGDYAASKALAEKLVAEVETFPNRGVFVHSLMVLAVINFEQHNIDAATRLLETAFLEIQKHKINRFANWYPSFIYKVILLALKHNIQNSIVRDWAIKNLDYLPSPPLTEYQWPWPVKIYTLGKLHIEVNGQSLFSSVRRDARALHLLKAIILNGGQISLHTLNEQLYPEYAEGKQQALLHTHLHRLRQVLNSDEAILRDSEQLKLNPKHCWCDDLAFLALLSTPATHHYPAEGRQLALSLYKGEYLPGENDSYNILSRREHLRGAYLSAVAGELTCSHLDTRQATELCLQAINIEPLSEFLYQSLIKLYLQQNLHHLAQTTYEQCRRVLKSCLDIEPSETTQALLDHADRHGERSEGG